MKAVYQSGLSYKTFINLFTTLLCHIRRGVDYSAALTNGINLKTQTQKSHEMGLSAVIVF